MIGRVGMRGGEGWSVMVEEVVCGGEGSGDCEDHGLLHTCVRSANPLSWYFPLSGSSAAA